MSSRIRLRVFAVTLLTALLGALLPTGVALADQPQVDGDANTAGVQSPLSLTGMAGQAQSTNAKIAVNFQSSNHLLAGDQVTFTVNTQSTSLPAGYSVGSGTLTIPTPWTSSSTSPTTSSIAVSFTAPTTPGSYQYNIKWDMTVRRGGSVINPGNALNGNATLTINFTATSPDTTPPVLSLPSNITAEATGPSGRAVSYTATATDAVDGSRPVSCSPVSGSTFAIATTTVNCSSSDTHGNTASGSFTVTVKDSTAPTVTPPASITAEATGSAGALVSYPAATASDIVDGTVTPTCSPASGSSFPLGASTVTCSATDSHGNTGTASFTITITDTTKPVLALPANKTAEATGPSGAPVTYTASASDIVDGSVPANCSPASGSTFTLGTTSVTCTATDKHGNVATGSFNITVADQTPPTLSLPASFSIEATGPSGAAPTFTASASDLVDGPVAVSCVPATGSTLAVGPHTINCQATDAAGNTASGSFVVNVLDTTAPTVTVPANIANVEATGGGGAPVTYDASAADLVDGAVNVSCTPASGSTFALGTTNVLCSASDAAGNIGTASFTVEVVDTTAPNLSLPGDQTKEATGHDGATLSYAAGASDLVSGTVPPSCTPVSGSTFPVGTSTVTCTASDGFGNTASASFTVTITDTTPPVVTPPSSVTAEASGPDGATVTFSGQSATDVVDGAIPVSCQPGSGSVFPLGANDVTCSATDAHGNTGTASFTVTVSDTTGPTLSLPQGVVAEATGDTGAPVTYTASATDAVDGTRPVSCSPASGATFALGDSTVSCSSSDTHSNTSTGGFHVTVRDTTPPTLHLPTAITGVEATGADGAPVTYAATATDIVDGAVNVDCSTPSGGTFALGITTVSCSSVDSHGNTATGSFTVEVVDTTAPSLSLPADITAEATSAAGAAVPFSVNALDVVSGATAVSCMANGLPVDSDATFALGATTVHCSSSDNAGNTASGSFTITVHDTTAPVLTVDNVSAEATGPDGAPVTYAVSATDAVTDQPVIACDHASGDVFDITSTTVSCTATDAAGNVGHASFGVTVSDTTAPTIAQISGVVAEATGADGAAVTYTNPTATDIVDGSLDVTCDPPSGTTFDLGAHTVTCGVTDAHGNHAEKTFSITVQDTTAPVLVVPENQTVEATSSSGAVTTYTASANDTVDGALTPACTPPSGSTFGLGSTSVSCSVSDHNGNGATKSFTIAVVDTTPPAVTVPAPITAEATGSGGAAVTFTSSAVDVVDGALTPTCSTPSGATFALGTTTVTCSATDAAGNTGTASFTVTVRDTTAPTIAHPSDVTAEATGPSGAAVGFTPPSASDLVDGTVASSCSPAAGSTFPLGTSTVTCTATDHHGNAASTTFAVTVVDTTKPVLSLPGTLTVPATSTAGATVTYAATASDLVSGSVPMKCSKASGSLFPMGPTAISCSAWDSAGNWASAQFTVQVNLGTVNGFFNPVDMTALNTQKGGSTVPLKFNLPAGPGQWVSDLGVVRSVQQIEIDCKSYADLASQPLPTTGSTALRYDFSGNQYIDNWSTPKNPNHCYRATVTFITGQAITARFKLT